MNVLQIINTLAVSDGGPPRNAWDLHVALGEVPGVRAGLVSIRRDREPVVVEPAPLPGVGAVVDGAGPLRLLRAVASSDVVIVHGYYLWWLPPVVAVASLLRKRVLLTPHSSFNAYKQRQSRAKKVPFDVLARPMMNRAVHAVAVGSPEEVAGARAKLPRPTIAVCGVGTAIPQLPVPPASAPPFVLLGLSRIAPEKRVDLLIVAVGELHRRGVAVRGVVAGAGTAELLAELRALAAREGVTDLVEFAGQVQGAAKQRLFQQADVFVAMSDDENFGINVAEALAHGLACVVSEFVPAAAGIEPAAGRISVDRSAAAIADSVESLLTVPRQDRFAAARAHAAAHFGWPAVAGRWMALTGGEDAVAAAGRSA